MGMRTPARRAFTVVELLVVIAIIGVMTAILLPAVQYARERARQTTCLNHLRQLAIGCTLHNNSFQKFPHAGLAQDSEPWNRPKLATYNLHDGGTKEWLGWGWAYQILPMLEQSTVANATPEVTAAFVNKVFFCPSRRNPIAVDGQGCGLPAGRRGGIDYAGNGGFGVKLSGRYVSGTRLMFPAPDSDVRPNGTIVPMAYFEEHNHLEVVGGGGVGLGSIDDGATGTILLGERNYNARGNPSNQDEDNGYVAGYTWDTIRWSYFPPARDRKDTSSTNDTRFGSAHSGGAQFAFCDGSTRLLSFNIDALTFQQLSSRDDGKAPDVVK